MRLVHVRTLELEDFIEGQAPPYAILSHRWGPKELNFKDYSKGRIDRVGICLQKAHGGLSCCHYLRRKLPVDRYMLHRQEEQRRAFRGNKLDVLMVREVKNLFGLSP